MADKKISALTPLATLADDDEFAVVDKDIVETKKITRLNARNDFLKGLIDFESAAYTINAGAITVTTSIAIIDTQGGAATDNLDTITVAGTDRHILIIYQAAGARDITVRHGVGNIYLYNQGNFTFNNVNRPLILVYDGAANWYELGSSAQIGWRDTTSNATNRPFIQSGKTNCNALTQVTFDEAFAIVPRVVATAESNNAGYSADIFDVQTTGFKCSVVRIADNTNQAANVNWMAIGERV